jgi:methylmalonyl-CoA mutase cobalamin-binding subunit
MIGEAERAAVAAGGRCRPSDELVAAGRAEARHCRTGSNAFLAAHNVRSEAAYKRRIAAAGGIMQHAHIGFRDVERTVEAIREVRARAFEAGAVVDRFGVTLDWTMAYPAAHRSGKTRGTGMVLSDLVDFSRLTEASPAAIHCGDFMLGLPAALENTKAALAAGVTTIGNLGQYFTFRPLGWDDDVATTEATVTAIALLAAQDEEILIHSNLDDGFAALFGDMSSSVGMILLERQIVGGLLGAKVAHCYGHHFSDPLTRLAFHKALAETGDGPGSMIYGNTVAYRSTPAGNYADCASYLMADVLGLRRFPTGHAINPVPVTENERIPSTDEIVDAQVFAFRLARAAPGYEPMIDWREVDRIAGILVDGGRKFARAATDGLAEAGVDTRDAAAMLLALRRIGPKRLEAAFGAGAPSADGRIPLVPASWSAELDHMAQAWLASGARPDLSRLTVCVGTTDVHEHGKYLVSKALGGLGVRIVDAGAAVDPSALVARALAERADAIALSTYNGVAAQYTADLMTELNRRRATLPVLVGGRLNEVRDGSNTDLPVDVTGTLVALGAIPCADLDAARRALEAIDRSGGVA